MRGVGPCLEDGEPLFIPNTTEQFTEEGKLGGGGGGDTRVAGINHASEAQDARGGFYLTGGSRFRSPS